MHGSWRQRKLAYGTGPFHLDEQDYSTQLTQRQHLDSSFSTRKKQLSARNDNDALQVLSVTTATLSYDDKGNLPPLDHFLLDADIPKVMKDLFDELDQNFASKYPDCVKLFFSANPPPDIAIQNFGYVKLENGDKSEEDGQDKLQNDEQEY
jgi:hypothetical protein